MSRPAGACRVFHGCLGWGVAALLWMSGLATPATAGGTEASAYGVIAHLQDPATLLVDVKEAPQIRWVNRQVTVRLRGISPAWKGSAAASRMTLNRLLLGQKVELLGCDMGSPTWRCNAQVSRDRQPDLRFDVADLLVANGLAKRSP